MNVTNETPLERVAYFNGSILPESEVRLPMRDRGFKYGDAVFCLLYTSPSPRDGLLSRMPSSA